MARRDDCLKKATKIKLGSRGFNAKSKIGDDDPNDLYVLKLGDRSSFEMELSGQKGDGNADVELYELGGNRKQQKQALKAIGKTDFCDLKKKDIRKYLKQKGRSKNKGNASEDFNLDLDAGTYYLRVYQKSGNTKYKLNINAEEITVDPVDPTSPIDIPISTPNTSSISFVDSTNTSPTPSVSTNSGTSTNSGSSDINPPPSESGYQEYYFTYSYGNGDSYSGYGYAQAGTYFEGQTILDSSVNETGDRGSYTISEIDIHEGTTSNLNSVYIDSYYDSENDIRYSNPVNTNGDSWDAFGSAGLGSEVGYVAANNATTYFSSGNQEADVPSNLDTYQYYEFTYNYGNEGDTYSGYGYATVNTYTEDQVVSDSSINETGYQGFYEITSVSNSIGSRTDLNSVYVESYFDSESGIRHSPVNTDGESWDAFGSTGLGSEVGYLVADNAATYFSSGNQEADIPSTIDTYQYYNFTYNYGNEGDTYSGYGYAETSTYAEAQVISDSSTNETGYQGFYKVNYVYNYIDIGTPSSPNSVYVSSYYDSEDDTTYVNLKNVSGESSYDSVFGSNGLGSEAGYLDYPDSTTYFKGGSSEADTSVTYQYYSFTYNYGNGDTYSGYGYAPGGTYIGTYDSPQTVQDTTTNETGYVGYYEVQAVSNYSGKSDQLNQVYVNNYYDSEDDVTYYNNLKTVLGESSYGTPFGNSGLGSEAGYLDYPDSTTYFKGGSSEADTSVTYQQYSFTYNYGNGDTYSGYGYASGGTYTGTYASPQTIQDSTANETGHVGYYEVQAGANYAGTSDQLDQVYVNSYYNSENDTTYSSLNNGSGSWGVYGTSGLGSELGYLDADDTSTQFSSYYEADVSAEYQSYNFTYSYGNGDIYTGSGYAPANTYTHGQVLSGYTNELGYTGSYTINYVNQVAGTTDELNEVYVSSYYNSENDTTYSSLSNSSANWGTFGTTGLGSESGYLDIDDSTTYFSSYNEADVFGDYQSYGFTYRYGNGDAYSGSGYAPTGTYTQGQVLSNYSNELGYLGSYEIDYISQIAGTTDELNEVYVHSYYNSENDTTYSSLSNGSTNWGVFGTTGLGSESGYLDADDSATYFSSYNEADTFGGYQSYSFTYSYGNGDTYSGSGYAPSGTYTGTYSTPQTLTENFTNETGYVGSYSIYVSSNHAGTTDELYKVYVYSYHNSENDTTYSSLSNGSGYWGAFGTTGLGSEFGYLDVDDSATYFSSYNEADTFGGYQSYNFTYSYGNGDTYQGYGYAAAGTYTQGQVLSNYSNETGSTGSYTIDYVSQIAGTTDELDEVYVWNYYDK